ncbi:FAD-dependent oxidoreductase, partial [Xanthomonas citri pv. citri]
MSRPAIVVGAGLAGLAAALALSRAGRAVRVHEASGAAGGRCRTFADSRTGRRIDNGTHVVLAGNRAVARYCAAIGSSARLAGEGETRFEFHDLGSGARFAAAPNDGAL